MSKERELSLIALILNPGGACFDRCVADNLYRESSPFRVHLLLCLWHAPYISLLSEPFLPETHRRGHGILLEPVSFFLRRMTTQQSVWHLL